MRQDVISIIADALNKAKKPCNVYGTSSEHINFKFDNEEYVIALVKVPHGRH